MFLRWTILTSSRQERSFRICGSIERTKYLRYQSKFVSNKHLRTSRYQSITFSNKTGLWDNWQQMFSSWFGEVTFEDDTYFEQEVRRARIQCKLYSLASVQKSHPEQLAWLARQREALGPPQRSNCARHQPTHQGHHHPFPVPPRRLHILLNW